MGARVSSSLNQTGYRWQESNPTPYLTGPILSYPILPILSDPILGTVRIPHREWHWRNHLPLKLGRPVVEMRKKALPFLALLAVFLLFQLYRGGGTSLILS